MLYYKETIDRHSGTIIAKIKTTIIIVEIMRFPLLLNIISPLLYERTLYMKFPFFASFLVFVLWLTYELKKAERKDKKLTDEFWERERLANDVRKKPLDDLTFISIPFDFIPKSLLKENPEVQACLETLDKLSNSKIVNLTGLSNTDIKYKYGAPNLAILSEYDDNFTTLIRTLNDLSYLYYNNGYESNARILLEKCVEYQSDVKPTYELLGKIYQSHSEIDKIQHLLSSVESLNSLSKKSIETALTSLLEESVHTD